MSDELNVIHPYLKKHLKPFFHIDHEFELYKNGPRADFILTCKETGIKLGVECKSSKVKKGSEVYDWIMQAKEYSELFKIPFFLFPHIQNRVFFDSNHKGISTTHNISTFLGRMGVGELLLEKRKVNIWGKFSNGKYKPPEKKFINWWKFIHSAKDIYTIHDKNYYENQKNYDLICP
jgi:hypothetical protein